VASVRVAREEAASRSCTTVEARQSRPNSSLTWLLDFTVCYVSWSTESGVGRAAYDVSEALYRDAIM
jgi:hypothetical protein